MLPRVYTDFKYVGLGVCSGGGGQFDVGVVFDISCELKYWMTNNHAGDNVYI